ncbi:tetratricopeptide repeat protein [Actinosynnema sp. CS-041913]|uniref:tetratricopeptide repeat protein n=1 Tax=Actinosynnema sp. CS-041913 TaxID=3239917 RepID=UPI003D8DA325
MHNFLTWAWEQLDDEQALTHAQHALDLYRTFGQPAWEARALNQVGYYSARLGDYGTARDHCQAALALYRQHDRQGHQSEGEASTLDSLGYIEHHTGHHDLAIHHYREALALVRSLGDATEAAVTLDNLGHPHVALKQYDEARTAWQEAVDLYRKQGRDTAARLVRQQLDRLDDTSAAPIAQPGATYPDGHRR